MGGRGSGDWEREDQKATVESCQPLDVNELARHGVLVPSISGRIAWTDTKTGRCSASVSFSTLQDGDAGLLLQLTYRIGATNDVRLPIRLRATKAPFGGRRWWFICPLIVNGECCTRRVAKLYLRGRYFGCRICHELTYRSCQEAHQIDRIFARVGGGPAVVRQFKRVQARRRTR